MSQGVNVPGTDGAVESGSIWDDLFSGAQSIFDKGIEGVEKWYELQMKRDIAELNYGSLATPPAPTAFEAPANPGPFEDISQGTILMIAGAAVIGIIIVTRIR